MWGLWLVSGFSMQRAKLPSAVVLTSVTPFPQVSLLCCFSNPDCVWSPHSPCLSQSSSLCNSIWKTSAWWPLPQLSCYGRLYSQLYSFQSPEVKKALSLQIGSLCSHRCHLSCGFQKSYLLGLAQIMNHGIGRRQKAYQVLSPSQFWKITLVAF